MGIFNWESEGNHKGYDTPYQKSTSGWWCGTWLFNEGQEERKKQIRNLLRKARDRKKSGFSMGLDLQDIPDNFKRNSGAD